MCSGDGVIITAVSVLCEETELNTGDMVINGWIGHRSEMATGCELMEVQC